MLKRGSDGRDIVHQKIVDGMTFRRRRLWPTQAATFADRGAPPLNCPAEGMCFDEDNVVEGCAKLGECLGAAA
jgi:hypothetical protein